MTLPPVVSRNNVPTPTPGATTTTLQIGTYNAVTDSFSLVLDLNDAANFYMKPGSIKIPQPPKTDVRSFNVRTPGERVVRVQRKTITVSWTFSIRGANAAAISSNIRSFMAAVENPPYVLRVALPGASFYSYLDIKKAVTDIPGDPILWNAKALVGCTIALEGGASWRGDRLTAQNLASNPGFEAPAGGTGYTQNAMPLAFNDPFANLNAYTLVGGGAMTLNPSNTFVDVVLANGGANLIRYYRLGETAGTTIYDIAGSGQTGAPGTHGIPTLGSTSLVSGDTTKSILFAAASSQYVSTPSGANLPTGNAAMTILIGGQIAANPAATAEAVGFGASATSHGALNLAINTSGKPLVDVGGGTGTVTSATALTTAAPHMIGVSWDGTTVTLWQDGASAGTATPGNQTVAASPVLNIGANTTPANYWNGNLQECLVFSAALTPTQISNIWTAFHSGATGTVANAASIPASGIQSFGSSIWGGTQGVQRWQCRFRWVSSLTAVFYLHRTDANNNIKVFVDGVNLTLYHSIGGVNNQLAQGAAVTTHEAWYWVQISQFPTVSGSPPYLQATLLWDSNGTVGTQIQQVAANAFDQVTAQSGAPNLMPSGAALAVGGVASGAGNQVQLFGPGGWAGVPNGTGVVTGQSSLSWDQTANHQYPNGPWTSYGAARIDLPPGGTIDARWASNGVSLAQTGIPVRTPGDTLSVSAWYTTTSGLSANATVSLHCNFYSSAFTLLSSPDAATATGAQTAWTQLSGTVVTPATAAYLQLDLRVVDTTIAGESAGATIWFDNVVVWNQTQCGQTSMPYAELRFTGGPAQIQVSGLQGDMPVPAIAAVGTYAKMSSPSNAVLGLARRLVATAGAQLVGTTAGGIGGSGTASLVLDPTSLGGYYASNTGTVSWVLSTPTLAAIDVKDYQGVYHLFWRFKSAQSLGNIGNVTAAYLYRETIPGSLVSTPLVTAQAVVPLAASATWTPADLGQLAVPQNADAGLRDQSQINDNIDMAGSDTSGGGPAAQAAGTFAFLPVDGSLLYGTLFNGGNGIFAGGGGGWSWFYNVYIAASSSATPGQPQASWGWNGGTYYAGSATTTGQLPDLARMVGGTGKANTDGINPTADPYLILDPTVGIGTTAGINQLVGFVADSAGLQGGMPVYAELYYAPLYLYPR